MSKEILNLKQIRRVMKKKIIIKRIIIISSSVLLVLVLLFLALRYLSYNTIHRNEVEDIRIIEETLQIAYRITKYEAIGITPILYYFSNIRDPISVKKSKSSTSKKIKFVEWTVLGGIIFTESSYNPTLTSNKDAKGMMQMLDSTYAYEREELGMSRTMVRVKKNKKNKVDSGIWNEFKNVPAGCNHLVRCIKMFDSYDEGLKAYYSGTNYKAKIAKIKRKDLKEEYVKKLNVYANSVLKEHKRLKWIAEYVEEGVRAK